MKSNKKESKKNIGSKASLLGGVMLACAVLSTPALADAPTASLFRVSCHEVSRELHQLMQANPGSPCIGDLDVASALVDAAEMLLSQDKTWQASLNLEQARYELYDISENRPHCAPQASSVKHSLANLIRAKAEIDAYEELKIKYRVVG